MTWGYQPFPARTAGIPGQVNTANALAASIANYLPDQNRVWTYRGRTQGNAGREAFLFFSLQRVRYWDYAVLPAVHAPSSV